MFALLRKATGILALTSLASAQASAQAGSSAPAAGGLALADITYAEAVLCDGAAVDGYTAPGTYLDTLVTADGRDSIRSLTLRAGASSFATARETLCPGESLELGGRVIGAAGRHELRLVNRAGCDSVLTLEVVMPDPEPLGPDTVLCQGAVYAIEAPPGIVTWSTGTRRARLELTASGTYGAEIISPEGCVYADSVEVEFETPFELPSAFSPNGDGSNDRYCVRPYTAAFGQQVSLEVFDRWGARCYAGAGAAACWDGDGPDNRPYPPGQYVAMVRYWSPRCGDRAVLRDVVLMR